MIGSWRNSAELGAVAGSLWIGAFSWYLIGSHTISVWFRNLVQRLHLRRPDAERARETRQARKVAEKARKAAAASEMATARAELKAEES